MSKNIHFMIHADVLAQSQNAAILGYGIVAFDADKKTGDPVHAQLSKVLRVRSMTGKYKASIDPATVLLLPKDQLKQWQAALDKFDGGVDFEPAMFAFSGFISDHRTPDSLFYFTDMSVYCAITGAYDMLGYRHQWSIESSRDLYSQALLVPSAVKDTPALTGADVYRPGDVAERNAQIARRLSQYAATGKTPAAKPARTSSPAKTIDENDGI